jgi:hypothetical protein
MVSKACRYIKFYTDDATAAAATATTTTTTNNNNDHNNSGSTNIKYKPKYMCHELNYKMAATLYTLQTCFLSGI